jgi:oligopeptide transport system substrate-binding protein
LNLVPPSAGYEAPQRLPLTVDGKTYDVLSFDPERARELLAKAGLPNGVGHDGQRLAIEYLYPALPHHRLTAEILQQQWQQNLNIKVKLVSQELQIWIQTLFTMEYEGVAFNGDMGSYGDPNWFLDQFMTGATSNCTGWADLTFDAMIREANATNDPVARMRKLNECERYLLTAMPFLPLSFGTESRLQKPYVHGIGTNPLDRRPFKYAWIDTKWKPQ